jgi:hypothetical protein
VRRNRAPNLDDDPRRAFPGWEQNAQSTIFLTPQNILIERENVPSRQYNSVSVAEEMQLDLLGLNPHGNTGLSLRDRVKVVQYEVLRNRAKGASV